VRFNPSKRLLAIVIGCILLAPVLRYLLIANAGHHGMFAAHVLPLTHFDALMLGVLFAWMRARDIAIPACWCAWSGCSPPP
jgi:peptidoglycan/LPS O-acetylase OafA/YrhL